MNCLSLLMLAVGVLWLNAPVFAANLGQKDVPFITTLVNPCNGKLVDTNGFVHIDATFTSNGQTAHFTIHSNPQGVTSIGETTGVHGPALPLCIDELSLVNCSADTKFVSRFDFIGQGSVPNFFIDQVMHITVNANGTVTASFNVLDTSCH